MRQEPAVTLSAARARIHVHGAWRISLQMPLAGLLPPDFKPIWLKASYRPAPSWGFIGKHDLDLGVAVEQDLTASAAGGASAWSGPNTGSAPKSSARCAEPCLSIRRRLFTALADPAGAAWRKRPSRSATVRRRNR